MNNDANNTYLKNRIRWQNFGWWNVPEDDLMIDKSFGKHHWVFDVHIVVPSPMNHQEAEIIVTMIVIVNIAIISISIIDVPCPMKHQESINVIKMIIIVNNAIIFRIIIFIPSPVNHQEAAIVISIITVNITIKVWSLPCLVSPSLTECSLWDLSWICQNFYMDFSKLLDGFVKTDTWISLSSVLNRYVKFDTWISCTC